MFALFVLLMFLSTIMVAAWLALIFMVDIDDWKIAAHNKTLENRDKIDTLTRKDEEKKERLAAHRGISAVVMKIILGRTSDKEIAKLLRQNDELRDGNLKHLSLLAMPGYALSRKIPGITGSGFYRDIQKKYSVLYGRGNAGYQTKHLLAKMLSYSIIGTALAIGIGAMLAVASDVLMGGVLIVAGTGMALLGSYSMYDSLKAKSKRRGETIARQFPAAVSKLALLMTSGMVMVKAWEKTAYSQNTVLYKEMQRVAEELISYVAPEDALGNFIYRCSTKETTKLASAMIQNITKGNAEIGVLLRDMAKEAWTERRHRAKRDSEKANSKLLIPIMLLFLVILMMILVPIAVNFSFGL